MQPVLVQKLASIGIPGAGLGQVLADLADNLTATGTTQADAYESRTAVMRFTTVDAGTGVKLDNGSTGDAQLVINHGANELLVYPHSGGIIDQQATNASYSLSAGTTGFFYRINSVRWVVTTLGGLDLPVTFETYAQVRAYGGPQGLALVTSQGIAGMFVLDEADTTTAENYGTVLVGAGGRRWKRVFSGEADVRWFGAELDVVTEDTAALQRAIDSGLPLLVPGIALTGQLVVPSNCMIRGIGFGISGFKLKNTANVSLFANEDAVGGNSNLDFRDFTIDGNYLNQAAAVHGVVFTKVTDSFFEIESKSNRGSGMIFSGGGNNRFGPKNTCRDNGIAAAGYGLYLFNSSDNQVNNGTYDNNCIGIAIEASGAGAEAKRNKVNSPKCRNNRSDFGQSGAGVHWEQSAGGDASDGELISPICTGSTGVGVNNTGTDLHILGGLIADNSKSGITSIVAYDFLYSGIKVLNNGTGDAPGYQTQMRFDDGGVSPGSEGLVTGCTLRGATPDGLKTFSSDSTVRVVECDVLGFTNNYNFASSQDLLTRSQTIQTYAKLRLYEGAADTVLITDQLTGGIFTRDDSDTTSADNGGTIIVASNGKRWKRVWDGLTVDIRWFGAVAGDAGAGATNYAACVAAAAVAHNIKIPSGLFYMSQEWQVENRCIYGEGAGYEAANARSRLHWPANTSGIKFTGTGSSHIQDVCLSSASSGAGTGTGLWIHAHGCTADRVVVQAFGSHGVLIDNTGGGNSNCFSIRRVRALQNYGKGFYVPNSADSNAGTLETCDATLNAGYGFHIGAPNTLNLHPHAANNGTYDYYDEGGSQLCFLPYAEAGSPGTYHFASGTLGSMVICVNYGQPAFSGDTTQNTVLLCSPTPHSGYGGLSLLGQVGDGQVPWTTPAGALRGSDALKFDGETFEAPNVKFPATFTNSTDPNTLDDYEEGNFTPTDASGAGLTFADASGRYTKIGRQVFAQISVTFPATANGSAVKIGGLPFASIGTPPVGGAFTTYTDAGRVDYWRIGTSSTELVAVDTAASAPANSAYSGKTIQLTIQYTAS